MQGGGDKHQEHDVPRRSRNDARPGNLKTSGGKQRASNLEKEFEKQHKMRSLLQSMGQPSSAFAPTQQNNATTFIPGLAKPMTQPQFINPNIPPQQQPNMPPQQQPSYNQQPLYPQFPQQPFQQQFPPQQFQQPFPKQPSFTIPNYQYNYQSQQQNISVSATPQSLLSPAMLAIIQSLSPTDQNVILQGLVQGAQQQSSPIHQVQVNINEGQPRCRDSAVATPSRSVRQTRGKFKARSKRNKKNGILQGLVQGAQKHSSPIHQVQMNVNEGQPHRSNPALATSSRPVRQTQSKLKARSENSKKTREKAHGSYNGSGNPRWQCQEEIEDVVAEILEVIFGSEPNGFENCRRVVDAFKKKNEPSGPTYDSGETSRRPEDREDDYGNSQDEEDEDEE